LLEVLDKYWQIAARSTENFNVFDWEDGWVGISLLFVRLLRERRDRDLSEMQNYLQERLIDLDRTAKSENQTPIVLADTYFMRRVTRAYFEICRRVMERPLPQQDENPSAILEHLYEKWSTNGVHYREFRNDLDRFLWAVTDLIGSAATNGGPEILSHNLGYIAPLGTALRDFYSVASPATDEYKRLGPVGPDFRTVTSEDSELREPFEILDGLGTVVSCITSGIYRSSPEYSDSGPMATQENHQ